MEEAHPIPQNVTAFQFHLIGDMTIKQFLYLAVGMVIAYLSFLLIFPLAPIVAIPIIAVSALLGVAFAFLPILDRPLDHWVKAYFKAVYSATQGKWRSPVDPPQEEIFNNRLPSFLTTLGRQVLKTTQPVKELEEKLAHANKTSGNPSPPPKPSHTPPSPLRPLKVYSSPFQSPASNLKPHTLKPSSEPILPSIDFSPQNNQPFQNPSSHSGLQMSQPSPSSQIPYNNPVNFHQGTTSSMPHISPVNVSQPHQPFGENLTLQNMSNVLSNPNLTRPVSPTPANKLPSPEELNKLVEMAKQARTLQLKLTEAEKQINQLTAAASAHQITSQHDNNHFQQIFNNLQALIKQADTLSSQATEANKSLDHAKKNEVVKVIETAPKSITPPMLLTSQPNVVNGIVKNNTGTYLDNVIVIIHDKDGLPVRALKTNKIGQFTGATPLPVGIYNITLEKDGLEFDTLQVTLNGEVMPPLEILAKGGGH